MQAGFLNLHGANPWCLFVSVRIHLCRSRLFLLLSLGTPLESRKATLIKTAVALLAVLLAATLLGAQRASNGGGDLGEPHEVDSSLMVIDLTAPTAPPKIVELGAGSQPSARPRLFGRQRVAAGHW